MLSGLMLARVLRVAGTKRNYEHHLWHSQILKFINTNWHPQSSFYGKSDTLSFQLLTQALAFKKEIRQDIWRKK